MKRKLFKPNTIIQHFKRELNNGKGYLYIVIGYGKDTTTLEDVAIYIGLWKMGRYG